MLLQSLPLCGIPAIGQEGSQLMKVLVGDPHKTESDPVNRIARIDAVKVRPYHGAME